MENFPQVRVLGCGNAFGNGGRMNTAFFIKSRATGVLMDCGATTLVAMKKYGLTVEDIDYVLLTHFHGDHYGGLPFLLLEAAKVEKRQKPLTIVSPRGARERLENMMELMYPGNSSVIKELPLKFVTYEREEMLNFSSFVLQSFPVVHADRALSHALKLEIDERVIGFSGDTEWCDSLIQVADGADLFICECNFYETYIPGHLDYKTLKCKKSLFKCRKMYLTHLGETMLNKAPELEWPCLEDGMNLNV